MPRVVDQAVHGRLASLLAAFDEILALEETDAILRRAVELAIERIGLMRVGIFLLDRQRNAMLGTWGTDIAGAIVDEHHIMYDVSDTDKEAFRRAEEEGAHFTVFENCPIVEHHQGETRVIGRGWVACTPDSLDARADRHDVQRHRRLGRAGRRGEAGARGHPLFAAGDDPRSGARLAGTRGRRTAEDSPAAGW